jgi:tripartite-type tricarboxylate transporter receptor subunit TctC
MGWFQGVTMKHMGRWFKALVAVSIWGIGWAHAQSYPSKTLRIIEPAGPGSAVDVFARKLAPALAERLGQAVVVDNKPGGNSAIGAREAARSPADGHTLFHANINNSLNDLLLNDPCCKLNDALQPVILLTSTPLVMVVHPSLGVKNLAEYQAWVRANPNKATFASGGSGSVTQMIGTKINMLTSLKVLEVPYKAIGAELPDLMAGHVSTAYLAPVVVAQLIKSGKLVALGVAGARRVPIIAEVPTLTEQGLSGAIAMGWNGLFVPAGTPKAVIQKLQAETAAIMATPAFVQDAKDLGYELGGGQADEFASYIQSELDRWGQVIREAKLK